MWVQQEQRSPRRIVSGAESLKSPGKKGRADFSPRPRQRVCQDPLTQQGGDALTSLIQHSFVRHPRYYDTFVQDQTLVSSKIPLLYNDT